MIDEKKRDEELKHITDSQEQRLREERKALAQEQRRSKQTIGDVLSFLEDTASMTGKDLISLDVQVGQGADGVPGVAMRFLSAYCLGTVGPGHPQDLYLHDEGDLDLTREGRASVLRGMCTPPKKKAAAPGAASALVWSPERGGTVLVDAPDTGESARGLQAAAVACSERIQAVLDGESRAHKELLERGERIQDRVDAAIEGVKAADATLTDIQARLSDALKRSATAETRPGSAPSESVFIDPLGGAPVQSPTEDPGRTCAVALTTEAQAQTEMLEKVADAVEDTLIKLDESEKWMHLVRWVGLTVDVGTVRIHLKNTEKTEDMGTSFDSEVRCSRGAHSWYGIANANTQKDAVRTAGQMLLTNLYQDIEFWSVTSVGLKPSTYEQRIKKRIKKEIQAVGRRDPEGRGAPDTANALQGQGEG